MYKHLPYLSEDLVENYTRAYKKRLNKLGVNESDLGVSTDVPTLQIKNKSGVVSRDGQLTLEIKATDNTQELEACHLLVNGVPVYGKKGKSIDKKSISLTENIRLNPGKNNVQVYVTNKEGVSSFKKSIDVISKELSLIHI